MGSQVTAQACHPDLVLFLLRKRQPPSHEYWHWLWLRCHLYILYLPPCYSCSDFWDILEHNPTQLRPWLSSTCLVLVLPSASVAKLNTDSTRTYNLAVCFERRCFRMPVLFSQFLAINSLLLPFSHCSALPFFFFLTAMTHGV